MFTCTESVLRVEEVLNPGKNGKVHIKGKDSGDSGPQGHLYKTIQDKKDRRKRGYQRRQTLC